MPADQIKKPSEVHQDDPTIKVVEPSPHSPTFKEQVYGQSFFVPHSLQVLNSFALIRLREGKVTLITLVLGFDDAVSLRVVRS